MLGRKLQRHKQFSHSKSPAYQGPYLEGVAVGAGLCQLELQRPAGVPLRGQGVDTLLQLPVALREGGLRGGARSALDVSRWLSVRRFTVWSQLLIVRVSSQEWRRAMPFRVK